MSGCSEMTITEDLAKCGLSKRDPLGMRNVVAKIVASRCLLDYYASLRIHDGFRQKQDSDGRRISELEAALREPSTRSWNWPKNEGNVGVSELEDEASRNPFVDRSRTGTCVVFKT
uniref:Uncharacterized protein n=1 Tax=Vespula pensylvanica TaxID=30213 RepID=A0A834NWU6_VESPE|nr:hypothetical protein H0235_010315 [Vespula pensylvanica]